ncbi:MAG: hypothetical protein HQK89_15895 [Nitrospirae bacterium]|nr:hypothetical protein [Nitrospirota bacterium]
MEDMKKLKSLVEHWKFHNVEHAETYLKWSEKVSNHEALSKVLQQVSVESIKVNDLLKEAVALIEKALKE